MSYGRRRPGFAALYAARHSPPPMVQVENTTAFVSVFEPSELPRIVLPMTATYVGEPLVFVPENKCPKCGKALKRRGAHFHIRKCRGATDAD